MTDLERSGADGRPRQGSGIQMLRLGEETVLCDLAGHQRCSLNETAAALWELCDGCTTVEEMADAVSLLFDVDRSDLVAGIDRALHELAAAGVIEWRR